MSSELIYVTGPVNYSIIKYKDIFIYNFGEKHLRENECLKTPNITIIQLLKNTFLNNADKIIDFFIETDHLNMTMNTHCSYMFEIITEFNKCLTNNASCPYKNVRFHRGDIRHNIELFYLIKSQPLNRKASGFFPCIFYPLSF